MKIIENPKMKIKSIIITVITTLVLTDSITAQATNKINCSEKAAMNEDGGEVVTKTCFYKKFKTISTGYPDYNGRYVYEYDLLKIQQNGSYKEI